MGFDVFTWTTKSNYVSGSGFRSSRRRGISVCFRNVAGSRLGSVSSHHGTENSLSSSSQGEQILLKLLSGTRPWFSGESMLLISTFISVTGSAALHWRQKSIFREVINERWSLRQRHARSCHLCTFHTVLIKCTSSLACKHQVRLNHIVCNSQYEKGNACV